MSEKIGSFPTVPRWRPDFRYTDSKLVDVELKPFKSTEPSVTDKEAYRLTLSSLRGELAQGSGRIDVGSYSLKAGQEYNPELDFSFLNRKDITIVEVDDYIKTLRERFESEDKELSEVVKAELAKAENKKEQLEKDAADKNSEVKE